MNDLSKAGAVGYFTKFIPGDAIVHAIRSVANGSNLLSQTFQPFSRDIGKSREAPQLLEKTQKLTNRELIILRLVAKGLSNKEISRRLGLSLPNVKVSLTTIFKKLEVSSRTEAISFCMRAGTLSFDDLATS